MRTMLLDVARRRGFTLVEMLAALTIAAILAGVMVKGGMMVVGMASNVLIVWEIAELNDAVEDFAVQFGDYPPDFHDQAAAIKFIQIALSQVPAAELSASLAGQSPASALYFWLAGPSGQGFSTDPTNPFASGGERRPGPLPPFRPQPREDAGQRFASIFLPKCYTPPPYVYFHGTKGYQGNEGYTSAHPYRDSQTRQWINADSFQILCAGQDGQFGAGNHFPGGDNYDKFQSSTTSLISLAQAQWLRPCGLATRPPRQRRKRNNPAANARPSPSPRSRRPNNRRPRNHRPINQPSNSITSRIS